MATHVPIEMEKFNSEKERRVGGGAYETLCYTYLQQVYESQNRRNDGQQEKQIHMFAFLRDPLDRFLSSLGQVLMGQKALLRKRLEPCHNSLTTADLIACVLHKMESTSSFLDEHFAPQSYELYIGMLGLNLSIDVMDLSLLSQVVVQLGGSRDHVHENSAVGTIDNYPQYRLTPASLTREFQERICQLYEADVLMIEQTGVTTTRCTDLTSTRE